MYVVDSVFGMFFVLTGYHRIYDQSGYHHPEDWFFLYGYHHSVGFFKFFTHQFD